MKISAPLLYFRAFYLTYLNEKFHLYCQRDPATGLPFAPTDFFENWKRPRSPTPRSKILKKIPQVDMYGLLQITEFGHPSSNRSRDI